MKDGSNQQSFDFIQTCGLSYIIMPRFEIDLETALANHKRHFRLDQIIALGLLLLDRLEALHAIGYVHGDLKPQNIMCSNKR